MFTYITKNTVCSRGTYVWTYTNVPPLLLLVQDVNVIMDTCNWFPSNSFSHTHTHTSAAAAVFQQNVLKWSIINESVCSWFTPHTNKILLFCREVSRLKQSAHSPSLSLPLGSRVREHSGGEAGAEGSAYLLLHAGKQSIFSAGCPVRRRPVETPHSCHLQSQRSHIPFMLRFMLECVWKQRAANIIWRPAF